MPTTNFYRTLAVAGLGLAATAMIACSQAQASHKKFVKAETDKWNVARLDIMYQVAEQQYRTGEYDKCRETLKDLIASGTPYAPMHVLEARVDLEGGSLEGAATHLKEAIRINGQEAEPYYLLGVVYQRWQKMETACSYYEQAAEHKPSEALYVLAVVEMKISMGQLDEVKQLLEDKMMYFEQSAAMRVALARVASLQGDPAGAAKYYRDAMLLVPEDQNVRWSYAQALYDAGKYGDVAKLLENMRSDAPVLPVRMSDSTQKPVDPAVEAEATKAAKISLLMMLGQSYMELKRPIDARECFQEVIRNDSANQQAYLALGRSCVMTNELTVSLAAARQVLRKEPDNVQAMILMAVVQQKQKKWSDALDTLLKAGELSPKNSTVLCMEGLSAQQLGRPEDATGYFERAAAANPKDDWATQLLGQAKPVVAEKATAQVAPVAGATGVGPVTTAMPGSEPIQAP